MKQSPLLSIGMIFKNEIRCLERCLKSLEPLRAAVPCELVMADTGSTDGSREVAARYADILFDFPWVNDFAAARNAVIDRSSGAWYLTVDADEWMDEDVSELASFLQNWSGRKDVVGAVIQRNYTTFDFSGPYLDFFAGRLVCMEKRPRYVGTIHEHWQWPGDTGRHVILRRTVLHHDGYVEVNTNGEAGRQKQKRNMTLLREKVEREPENLMVYLQMLESGQNEPDYQEILRQAIQLVEERKSLWEMMGPPILRYGVTFALMKKLPEAEEWIQKAEEWFPNSAFIQIDVAFQAFSYFLERDEFEEAARRGEIYLKALEEDRAGRLDPSARLRSAVQSAAPLKEQAMKIALADAYRNLERAEEARELLMCLDFSVLDQGTTGKLAQALMNLQMNTRIDTAGLAAAVWDGISAPLPDRKRAKERKRILCETMLPAFRAENREREEEKSFFFRHTYTVLLPLTGKCELGTAAAILETEDVSRLEQLLATVEDWTVFPPEALDHAIRRGVRFPLKGRTLNIEIMDLLAAGLAGCGDIFELISLTGAVSAENTQELCWSRGLVFAAMQEWEDVEQKMALARRFVEVERVFLPLCYAGEVLREERIFVLPPMHRFGWYCVQAFDALDSGDAPSYARLLRTGLASCAAMMPMVEFLTKNTPELQTPPPSPELLALAEKVRTVLAACPADDPAVTALKASPAYRKVAHLIERDEI
nr:glycosyltransferase [uncultured Oscillibacter sp.]